MAADLSEVPGAGERPGGCRIKIVTDGNSVTITLPPRGVSLIVFFFAAVLLGNLLVALYTGLMLLLENKSVLGMAQIAPSGLPVPLKHQVGFLLFALALAEALGVFTLAAILRPIFFHETLTLDGDWLKIERSEWGHAKTRALRRADVRGFTLRRVPPGLDAGTLFIQGRGEEVEIGEGLREADREWLASVGNVLLAQ